MYISEGLEGFGILINEWDRVGYPSKTNNKLKSREILPITYCSLIKSFRNFRQSTAVSLSCSVQNFKTIWPMKWMFCANEISRDLSLRCLSCGYLILIIPQDRVSFQQCSDAYTYELSLEDKRELAIACIGAQFTSDFPIV